MQRPNSKSSTSTDCSIYSKNNFKKESHYSSNRQGQQFLSEANAFIQLSYNRFNDILNRVIQLLNNLRTKKLIFHFIPLLFSLISVRYTTALDWKYDSQSDNEYLKISWPTVTTNFRWEMSNNNNHRWEFVHRGTWSIFKEKNIQIISSVLFEPWIQVSSMTCM